MAAAGKAGTARRKSDDLKVDDLKGLEYKKSSEYSFTFRNQQVFMYVSLSVREIEGFDIMSDTELLL